jgi:hypothetical protein
LSKFKKFSKIVNFFKTKWSNLLLLRLSGEEKKKKKKEKKKKKIGGSKTRFDFVAPGKNC